jgi:GT2 family glycosyltransferase
MKTTVVIPNYNGKKFMEPCMEALSSQTQQDFCVLIVDNGSTDGSLEWMEENLPGMISVQKGEALKKEPDSQNKEKKEIPVYLLALSENIGFSGAVNLGIRMAATDYVILLNNDTQVDPHYIQEMEKAMDENPRAFSVSSKMIQMLDHSKMDDAGDLYTIIGWGFQRGVGQKSSGYQTPRRVFTACAGAAIYRRSVFQEIGLFDELHFAYLEDLDVGYRARIAGYENRYCPTAVVYHYGSGTSGSKYNPFKVRLAARNSVYLNYKNMPLLQLVLNGIFLAVGYAIKLRFFTKRGFGKEYREGLKEGFTTLYKCHRVKFQLSHLPNYIRIEWELIINMVIYAYEYGKRHLIR